MGLDTDFSKKHYLPLLNKLANYKYNKIDLSDKDKRILLFLLQDIKETIKGDK